ncbi:MAG: hypothetical protein [Circular genetic element sp.]|nr:MAG: hypothetical protein [Circular genetic element sp.]
MENVPTVSYLCVKLGYLRIPKPFDTVDPATFSEPVAFCNIGRNLEAAAWIYHGCPLRSLVISDNMFNCDPSSVFPNCLAALPIAPAQNF